MTDKPKVHVFLGAPCSSLSASARDAHEDSSDEWKTLELSWDQGQLRPRTNDRGVQVNPDSVQANISSGHVNIDVSKGHFELATTSEGHSLPLFEEDGENVVTANPSPPVPLSQRSQKKNLSQNDDDLCSESLQGYLDSCFPLAQPLAVSECQPSCSDIMSVESLYLSVWTKSQALLMKRTSGPPPEPAPTGMGSPHTPLTQQQTPVISRTSPELYSPHSSPGSSSRAVGGTLQPSLDRFSEILLSQRQQEGGLMLERTPDGLLCTQGIPAAAAAPAPVDKDGPLQGTPLPCLALPSQPTQTPPGRPAHSSPVSPARKKSRLSPTTPEGHHSKPTAWGGCITAGPPTLLARCKTHGVQYSILAAVVHPSHLQEVKMKRGAAAGSAIPLATLIVTDQSDVEMKVVMWRTAAFWVLTVQPGDVLLITGIRVHEDKWRGETVLQSSYTSKLLNLGQVTNSLCPSVPQAVNRRTLGELCAHLQERRPLLLSLPRCSHQDLSTIPYAKLKALRPDTLVHALVRVTHTNMVTAWRDEAQGISRVAGVQRSVLTVEQADGHQGAVVLWGAALAWLERIQKHKEALWDFRMLLVKQDVTSGLLELHSTPWGSCQVVSPSDNRCAEFLKLGQNNPTNSCIEIDLRTLLSQKYTGDVELKAQITGFQFQGSLAQNTWQVINSHMSLERILEIVSGDVTFTGCGRCAVELDTDDNGIYRPCYPCLPHTAVRHYYRPVVLTVKDGEFQVYVQVPPTLVQRVLLNTPPDKLSKTVAPSSDVRHVQVVAERIHSLLATARRSPFLLTVRSHIQCDENSVPIIQDFVLLDFSPVNP
ncbi:shieldin complex subunit 2 [Alosa pseudoharengus]|uniref:shieldin complex subunit 2 n=1 Tax=Alosa pseudoharengus TaxID=34774 RepID=UPI003F8C4E4F